MYIILYIERNWKEKIIKKNKLFSPAHGARRIPPFQQALVVEAVVAQGGHDARHLVIQPL
jgi:hypothetical protein